MKKTLLFLSLIASFGTLNAQWTSQGTGFDAQYRGLSDIRIVDANTVWALAYDGSGAGANVQECTVTTDGGASWTAHNINLEDATLDINNILPVSANTAWLSAIINVGNNNPSDGVGYVFKTVDGGQNWNQQSLSGFQTAGSSFLNSVYFFNDTTGVAYGDPVGGRFEIYRTTDGGDTWTAIASTNSPVVLSGEYGYNSAPTAVGSTLWFTTNKGRIVKTTDMGATWAAYQAPINDFGGTLPNTGNQTAITNGIIRFSNTSIGYLLKSTGSVANTVTTYYTTTNGGQSWSTNATAFSGTRKILNYIPGTTTIVATSQAAPIGTSVSTNNGTSWQSVESAQQRGASAFFNATTGWCAGYSDGDPFGTQGIYKLTGLLGVDTATVAKFKVYPNPANSVVTISTPEVDSAKLSVTDLSGKVVMAKTLTGIENTVDISSLATGAYFFELSSDSKKEVIKILKN